MVAELKLILESIVQHSQDQFLSLSSALKIAVEFDCSLRNVEQTALEHSIVPTRFKRNSLSCLEQLRLFLSRVAIVGCGGLGGRTAELLTRLGVGHLNLTDPDSFSESNLNRQVFCTVEALGQDKVEVLANELTKINPVLETTTRVNCFNADSIAYADVVVDCLDSPQARKELSALCLKQNVPLVHGAVKEWYGQAGVEQKSHLLIDTLYPDTLQVPHSPPTVLSMTVALTAAIQATETCKYLLGKKSSLNGNILQTDLLRQEYEMIPYKTD